MNNNNNSNKEIIFKNNNSNIEENSDNNENYNVENFNNSLENNKDNNTVIEANKENNNIIINENNSNNFEQNNNSEKNNKINIIKLDDNGNNSNEEIVFLNANSNNEIKDFISDVSKEVVLEQEVFIKEDERIYTDDIIYLTEIQNQILSSYPVSKQGLKYIQENAEDLAKEIIKTANMGFEKYNLLKNNIQYKLIFDYLNNNFNSKWVIPIVYDKHKIYSKLKDDYETIEDDKNIFSENENKENYFFTESLEDSRGIIEENQRNQHIILKSISHQSAIGKITYKNFLNDVNNIIYPYIEKTNNNSDINVGYITSPKNSNLVLRYYDMDNTLWNTRVAMNEVNTKLDILDENKKIKDTKEISLINGEKINIIGFMVIPFGGENMSNFIDKSIVFTPDNYLNHLNKPFYKVGNINRIYSNTDSIIIDIPNHNIKDGEKIYISNTNSFPNINNVYQKSVKVINENSILIKSNIKIINEGTYGIIYKTSDIEYDLYDITKGIDNFNINFVKSNYNDKIESDIHNKIYLFNSIKIASKDELKNIINIIFPSLDNIILFEKENLKKCYTIDDVNKLLKKYNISINDLFIENINTIKNILTENMNKIIEQQKNIKINNIEYHLSDKKLFIDDTYYLSDKYINSPDIIKYYGNYPYFNMNCDCSEIRLNWIHSQKDFGELFFINILLSNNKKNNKNILKYISDKKSEYIKEFEDVNKNYKKEQNMYNKVDKKYFTYQPYIVRKSDIENEFSDMKKVLPNKSTIFLNGEILFWVDKKPEIMKDIPDNTFALVNNDLWVCKNDKWTISDLKPSYDSIIKICMLDNIDISEITLDDLEYLIRKDTSCKSKSLLRIEDKYKLLEDIKNKYSLLEEYCKNNEFIKQIETKKDKIIQKYYIETLKNSVNNKLLKNENYILDSDDKNENSDEKKNKKTDKLHHLLNAIYNIKNMYDQQNLIYDIIDKDGILIGMDIYSKKYKRKMGICGHNIFFKNAANSNDIETRDKILKDMLSKYSDNGKEEKNNHICINCGEFLLNNDFDDTEGFNNNGMIIKSRFIWKEENIDTEQEEVDFTNIAMLYQDDEIEIDCHDDSFKSILLDNGLSTDNIEEASEICSIIKNNLYSKVGINLSNKQLISLIIDSIQKINEIPNYNLFLYREIKKYQDKGFSKSDIEKMNSKGIFKGLYNRNKKLRKYSIIAARFLITVQTSIPVLKRITATSICPFNSFYDDDGFNFMACILKEMQFVEIKEQGIEVYKSTLIESYNNFKKSIIIRNLFKEKEIYNSKIRDKKDYFKYDIINSEKELIEVSPLDKDFKEKIFKISNIDEFKYLHDLYIRRLNYVNKKIKKIIRNVISKSELSEPYFGLPELSCCKEDIGEYISYYVYIQENSDEKIFDLINESNELYEYSKLFLNYGVSSRIYFNDKNKNIGIFNNFDIDNIDLTDDSIIKLMFETYVDEGYYKGTKREYIGSEESLYDLKSGKTKNEIINASYTIEQYKDLLNSIENINKKIYVKDEKPVNKFLNLKNEYSERLNSQIKVLVSNIAIVLNKKDKDFESKYIDFIKNMGIFKSMNNIYKKNDNISKKKNEMNQEKYRFNYLKKVYIQYILKYSNMIKNNINKKREEFDIQFSKDLISKEIQTDIYKYYDIFDKFLHEDVSKFFSNVVFDYSSKDIDTIFATDILYDYKFEKIKKYSDFNFNDASNVMLYIIVSQLNKIIIFKGVDDPLKKDELIDYEDDDDDLIKKMDTMKSNMKTIRSKYICEFILLIFHLIDEDNEIFEKCENETEKIKNSFIHEIIQQRSKIISQDEDTDYFSKMLSKMSSRPIQQSTNEFDEKINNDQKEINDNIELEDKVDDIKYKLTEKYGKVPGEDKLDNIKRILQNSENEENMEEFDPNGDSKGDEVLDQGASYSGFNDYDFETGDGFDYSGEV
jgi:hypothetical protein